MKKTILLLTTIIVISVGFLSGCNESTNNDDINENSNLVELVNYNIETFGAELGNKPEKIGDGFIHDERANNGYYKITGTIKNIAGRTLDNITVKVDFYDINHTYLTSESDYVIDLANASIGDFKIILLCYSSCFEEVEQIEFDISAI
ncbi:MAG: hypothetical protein AYK22_01050 [Thermoplasmatales archaeon SG8-52-3]|nr:MAG: hypothetical protein AYK22_01050 [Thermoplasmatales archaeon SG8-52-3]